VKTILILSNASGYGGAERNLKLVAAALARRFRVVVFVENEKHGANLTRIGHPNLTVIPFRKGKGALATVGNLWTLRKWIARQRPIAILVNSNKGGFYLALYDALFHSTDMRVLLFVHDFQWRFVPFILRRLRHAIVLVPTPALLESPDYIARFVSREQAREHQRQQANVMVVPNLVLLTPAPVTRAEDIIGRQSSYILCLAAIAPIKGLDLLVEAFSAVASACVGIRLVVCGDIVDPEYAGQIRKRIKCLTLENRIEMRPFQDDVAELYKRALFLVNTSVSSFGGPESFGRTIVEAWSYGKPVIAFRCGGPKYVIDNGRDGYLVEEGNVKELSFRMLELVKDEGLRVRMGRQGYEKMVACYTEDRIIPKLDALLEDKEMSA